MLGIHIVQGHKRLKEQMTQQPQTIGQGNYGHAKALNQSHQSHSLENQNYHKLCRLFQKHNKSSYVLPIKHYAKDLHPRHQSQLTSHCPKK
jgi:hypothetical protein